jgi:hypothetical protein
MSKVAETVKGKKRIRRGGEEKETKRGKSCEGYKIND